MVVLFVIGAILVLGAAILITTFIVDLFDLDDLFLAILVVVTVVLGALLVRVLDFVNESLPTKSSGDPAATQPSAGDPGNRTGLVRSPENPGLYSPCEPYAPYSDADGDGWGSCVPTKESVQSLILFTDPWTLTDCCPYKVYFFCSFIQQSGVAISEIEFTISVKDTNATEYFRDIRFTAEMVSGVSYDCPNSEKYFWVEDEEPYGYPNYPGDPWAYELDVFVKSIRMNNAEFVEFDIHEVKVDWDE